MFSALYRRARPQTMTPSHFLLHKKTLLLRSQLSCCRFPRAPAVSTAPPPCLTSARPLAERPVSQRKPRPPPPLTVPDVTGSVPTRKHRKVRGTVGLRW